MRLLICALFSTFLAGMAQAQVVNRVEITGILELNYDHLTNSAVIVTTAPVAVEPAPVVAPVQPAPQPASPLANSACMPSPTLVCAYDIDWTDSSNVATRIQVQPGKTLASRFTTGPNPAYQVTLNLQPPAGYQFSQINFWISQEPDGTAVPRCSGQMAIEGSIRIFQQPRSGCVLSTNTTYYLNMKHVNDGSQSSTIDRKQSVFGTP